MTYPKTKENKYLDNEIIRHGLQNYYAEYGEGNNTKNYFRRELETKQTTTTKNLKSKIRTQ